MGFEGIHDGVQQRVLEVWRVGKLFLSVSRGQLRQSLILKQLALEHAIHIDQLVIVAQPALGQPVHRFDDFNMQDMLLVLKRTAARPLTDTHSPL